MQAHVFFLISFSLSLSLSLFLSVSLQIIRALKQPDVKSTHVTPTLPSYHPNYETSPDGTFLTDAIRLSSPYRTQLISINGESQSETEIVNKKEKAVTGEINICPISKFMYSSTFFLHFFCIFFVYFILLLFLFL